MSLLWEAVRAGFQPCSYSLLILALVVLGLQGPRRRLPALGVYYLAALLGAWLPFTGFDPRLDGRVAGTLTLLAGLVMAGWHTTGRAAPGALRMVGVGLVGAFAGATWLPCVGPELGSVLTAATTDPRPGLPRLGLYLLGVMWVVAVLAVVGDRVPRVRRVLERRQVSNAFGVVGGLLVMAVAVDLYPLLLSHLARLSSL